MVSLTSKQDHDGHWYTRMRPYRTLDNRIKGAVLAFIDIDSIKDAERLRQALQQERRLAAVVRDARDGRIFRVRLTTTVLLDNADKPAAIALNEREVA